MMRFEQGKSYLWLFPIFGILFLVGSALCSALGDSSWGVLTMPAFIAFLVLGELRSRIALDSWWRASHPRGSWRYQAMAAWHITGVILLLVFSCFLIL